MSKINKYVGARYVPLHLGDWDNTKVYEPLSVVSFIGASYTSKTYVPKGANITDLRYWVCTGNYNAQVEAYRQETVLIESKLMDLKNSLVVNVKDYGAIGDGISDDTTAIQNALNFAENDISHTLFFPKGTYRVGGVGTIFTSKFVSMKGDNAKIYVVNGNATTDIFTFIGCANNYNGVITGIEFDYLNNNFTMVRNVFNFIFQKDSDILYGLEISKCIFRKNNGYKIFTNGWTNGGFNNCRFNNNIVWGLFLKSLSFGDSNKINGNSLYGSEEIQLGSYVIDATQTSGSAGCEVSGNNCTSGLGRFSGFIRFKMSNNQIENTTQTWLDYILKLEVCRDVFIDSCNLNSHLAVSLIFSSGNNVRIQNSWLSSSLTLITSPNHPFYVSNIRGNYGATAFTSIMPYSSCSGIVTMYNYCDDTSEIYIDSSLVCHALVNVLKSYSIAPFKIKGNISVGMTITTNDGGIIYFNSNNSLRFDVFNKIPFLMDATF